MHEKSTKRKAVCPYSLRQVVSHGPRGRRRQLFITRIELHSPDRWLLTGQDLDVHREWATYAHDLRNAKIEPGVQLLRLGLYDPLDESTTVHWTGPIWTDSRADRVLLSQILRQWRLTTTPEDPPVALGVFEYQPSEPAGE